jgi:hypothetical protein
MIAARLTLSRPVPRAVAVLLWLYACKRSPAEGTPVPPPPTASEAQLPQCPPLNRAGAAATPPTRAQAVAFAETFIRAAGYAESPATCLASDSVFGLALAHRRGQLQAKAYATKREPPGWAVIFLYNPQWLAPFKDAWPDGPDSARAVLIDDQTGRGAVVPQDAIVEAFDRWPLSIAGGMARGAQRAHHSRPPLVAQIWRTQMLGDRHARDASTIGGSCQDGIRRDVTVDKRR